MLEGLCVTIARRFGYEVATARQRRGAGRPPSARVSSGERACELQVRRARPGVGHDGEGVGERLARQPAPEGPEVLGPDPNGSPQQAKQILDRRPVR